MLGLTVGIFSVVSLIALGTFLKNRKGYNTKALFMASVSFSFILLLLGAFIVISSVPAMAQHGDVAAAPQPLAPLAAVAAALSTGLACIGAGLAVGSVGSAALGLIGEKPDMMGRTLIYVALAEGIAIYGMLISILIMFR